MATTVFLLYQQFGDITDEDLLAVFSTRDQAEAAQQRFEMSFIKEMPLYGPYQWKTEILYSAVVAEPPAPNMPHIRVPLQEQTRQLVDITTPTPEPEVTVETSTRTNPPEKLHRILAPSMSQVQFIQDEILSTIIRNLVE